MKRTETLMCGKLLKRCLWADSDGLCNYGKDGCDVIIEKCEGCENIVEIESEKYCKVFACPKGQWSYGDCFKASHKKEVWVDPRKLRKLNPIKLSKRKNRM